MKKCRARYGLDQQSQWCKPCRYVCYGRHAFFQSCALAMKQSSDRAYNLYDLRVYILNFIEANDLALDSVVFNDYILKKFVHY